MKITILLASITLLVACRAQTKAAKSHEPLADEVYYSTQEKIFKEKSAELAKMGRIPAGYDAIDSMSQYGWHPMDDGSFGAYTFYQPAFEQAKQTWVVSHYLGFALFALLTMFAWSHVAMRFRN